jgi:hypothetical protein
MPEYLSPGVYVEEVSFRSKFLEGVSTSTCGLVGQTSFGPTSGRPEVVTGFGEFQRRYGGLEDLVYGKATNPAQVNYTAHAARAFFDNGGKRLYVTRAFAAETSPDSGHDAGGYASLGLATASPLAKVRARYPGSFGNALRVRITLMSSQGNLIGKDAKGNVVLRGVYEGALVQAAASTVTSPPDLTGTMYHVRFVDGVATLFDEAGTAQTLPAYAYLVELQLAVSIGGSRNPDYAYANVAPHKRARAFIGTLFDPAQPADPETPIAVTGIDTGSTFDATALAKYLLGAGVTGTVSETLAGGNDGKPPASTDYEGDSSNETNPSGLYALGHVDDIAIVMAPDAVAGGGVLHAAVNNHLIAHCESLQYRFAILDEPKATTSGGALDFRSKYDSSHAAIYYPWVKIADPRAGQDGKLLALPPSGFVAGIYARTDLKRGVWKAPANEPVLGAQDFEFHVHKGVQDVLNPRGVNCLRFFEEGGFRVWGARTLSSDPEWRYINVRRLFIYLEHSIDKGTQWVVFEPNNERTWSNVKDTISAFLLDVWKAGALVGAKPEEAFFVRCDRTTMTQNDLDNGRLVCLVGLAPAYPAEFVIFRIGQWTADATAT